MSLHSQGAFLLGQAGSGLLVLEVESQEVCQTGLQEEAELQWKEDQEASLAPCQVLALPQWAVCHCASHNRMRR